MSWRMKIMYWDSTVNNNNVNNNNRNNNNKCSGENHYLQSITPKYVHNGKLNKHLGLNEEVELRMLGNFEN